MKYKEFDITVLQRESGCWQAVIRRLDGADVCVFPRRQTEYRTIDAISDDLAIMLARVLIDTGSVQ
jgi:hypothetical protein